MTQQHYMLEFLSDQPKIDAEYDNPQIYINEVLMIGDLFTFHNQPELRENMLNDYGTDLFKITKREFCIADEDLGENPETTYILITLVPIYQKEI